MNWVRIIIATVVSAIVLNIADFVMHAVIMANTYSRYALFSQDDTNPIWFLVVAIFICFALSMVYAKSMNCWGAGAVNGAKFGVTVGLVVAFTHFYHPLVLEGFPYYLSWCWAGITLIGFALAGAVIAALYKK